MAETWGSFLRKVPNICCTIVDSIPVVALSPCPERRSDQSSLNLKYSIVAKRVEQVSLEGIYVTYVALIVFNSLETWLDDPRIHLTGQTFCRGINQENNS
jgi:hypothetical protein